MPLVKSPALSLVRALAGHGRSNLANSPVISSNQFVPSHWFRLNSGTRIPHSLHNQLNSRKRCRPIPTDGDSDAKALPGEGVGVPEDYWPLEPFDDDSSGRRCSVRWEDYPFLPVTITCDGPVLFECAIPSRIVTQRTNTTVVAPYNQEDLYTPVPHYNRGDFWNLADWVGPPLLWGVGHGFGIAFMHDPAPFYHKCTLARDFITYWPLQGPDPSMVGTCRELVPLVCGYCWGQSWRQCDTVPRVGAYDMPEAHISPVLDECDHCGLTSDFNIVRCMVHNDLSAVLDLVELDKASATDVFHCMRGIQEWPTATGFMRWHNDESCTTYIGLLSMIRSNLRDALDVWAPGLAHIEDITGVIMMYWQGVDMTTGVPQMCDMLASGTLRPSLECAHAFPCVPGDKCVWLDWAQEWVNEMVMIDGLVITSHVSAWFPGIDRWQPDSWAVWSIIRGPEEEADFDDDQNAYLGANRGRDTDDDEELDDDEKAAMRADPREFWRARDLEIQNAARVVVRQDDTRNAHKRAARGGANRVRANIPSEDPAYVQTLMAMERVTGYTYTTPESELSDEGDEGDEGEVSNIAACEDVTAAVEEKEKAYGDDGNDNEAEGAHVVGHDDLDAEADDNINMPTELEEEEYELRLYRDGWE